MVEIKRETDMYTHHTAGEEMEPPTINVIPNLLANEDPVQNVDDDARDSRKQLIKEGAITFAGFLYWTNFVGVLFLFIGFIAPGWLTVKSRITIFMEYDKDYSHYVFQDYSLWYMTQCTGAKVVCDTMTYRLIDAVSDGTCGTCQRLEIGSFETDRFMVLSGTGLVFSYAEFVRAQVMYTLGVAIAMFTLSELRSFRKHVNEDKDSILSKKKWIFLLLVGALCVCFVLIPTFMFVLMFGKLGWDRVRTPVGSVFAGIGGLMMAVVVCTIFLQLACCNSEEGVYICYTEMDTGKQETEEGEEEEEEEDV